MFRSSHFTALARLIIAQFTVVCAHNFTLRLLNKFYDLCPVPKWPPTQSRNGLIPRVETVLAPPVRDKKPKQSRSNSHLPLLATISQRHMRSLCARGSVWTLASSPRLILRHIHRLARNDV